MSTMAISSVVSVTAIPQSGQWNGGLSSRVILLFGAFYGGVVRCLYSSSTFINFFDGVSGLEKIGAESESSGASLQPRGDVFCSYAADGVDANVWWQNVFHCLHVTRAVCRRRE